MCHGMCIKANVLSLAHFPILWLSDYGFEVVPLYILPFRVDLRAQDTTYIKVGLRVSSYVNTAVYCPYPTLRIKDLLLHLLGVLLGRQPLPISPLGQLPLWKTAASLNIVPTSWDSTCPVNNYYRVITTCCLYSLRTTLRGHSVYLENKSWSTSSVQFYSFSPFLSFLLLPLVLILRELPNKSIAGNLCLKVYFSGMLT